MAIKLWGKEYKEADLEARLGDRRQLADIQLCTLADGAGGGMRVARLVTCGGFDVEILLDRGMDLGQARYRGIPLTWRGPGGLYHPHRAEHSGKGWVRVFNGGLMSLCGLDNIGPPSRDVILWNEVGQHGRVTYAQAEDVSLLRNGETGVLGLTGTLMLGSLGGHKLRVDRTLETTIDGTGLMLHDRIRNVGGIRAPLMVLYHSNFGWPLVSEDMTLTSPALQVEPRDESAARGSESWDRFSLPEAGFEEQVFFHGLAPAGQPNTFVSARIENRHLGIGVELSFDSYTLTHLTQWKLCGHGDYVLGVEPGNSPPIGQEEAHRAGALPFLEPGESFEFHMKWRCYDL